MHSGVVRAGSISRRTRWEKVRSSRWLSTRRARIRLYVVFAATIALSVPLVNWLTEAPKIEPPFETIVELGTGLVKEFALADVSGSRHDRSEWHDKAAIVLFFLGGDGRQLDPQAAAIKRLAGEFGPRGFQFYGVLTGPELTAPSAASHATGLGLPFPILLDPREKLARQAGAGNAAEAVVLAPDGQVVYRSFLGVLDERPPARGRDGSGERPRNRAGRDCPR